MQKINFKNLPDTSTPLNASTLNQMQDNIENAINNIPTSEGIPVGTIHTYAGSTAPTGYMICDGSAVSRITYSDLFDVIGITYGSGDGSTTFNIPNLKGKVPVGLDSNDTDFDTLGETGGSKYLQEHSHGATNGNFATENTSEVSAYGSGNATLYKLGRAVTTATAGTGNSGNLQPYIVLNYIIKY